MITDRDLNAALDLLFPGVEINVAREGDAITVTRAPTEAQQADPEHVPEILATEVELAATVSAQQLAWSKAAAKRRLDGLAERVRLAFVTPGDGQALVYREKAAEARAHAGNQSLIGPLLQAEADRSGRTVLDVAVEWNAKATAWSAAAAEVETIRLDAKDAIDAAADQAAIDAVFDNLPAWPTP